MNDVDHRLLRVGVFYDGNFLFHVSNFYRYVHARRQRISIPGLHEFIRHHVAEAEGADVRYCHIVDSHYFRGRLSASEADAKQKLYVERVFDDVLMGEGVVTHYLPIRRGTEKGIDVWLALEAFELAVYKRFNVLVLIAGDSDFIPLARKLNSLGTRVMILGWDFNYKDDYGHDRETVTSIHLLNEVTYPVMMHALIDDKTRRDDRLINGLFYAPKEGKPTNSHMEGPRVIDVAGEANRELVERSSANTPQPCLPSGGCHEGEILRLKEGYGFIKAPEFPSNVFFHWSALSDIDFESLQLGTRVTFAAEEGPQGPTAKNVSVVL